MLSLHADQHRITFLASPAYPARPSMARASPCTGTCTLRMSLKPLISSLMRYYPPCLIKHLSSLLSNKKGDHHLCLHRFQFSLLPSRLQRNTKPSGDMAAVQIANPRSPPRLHLHSGRAEHVWWRADMSWMVCIAVRLSRWQMHAGIHCSVYASMSPPPPPPTGGSAPDAQPSLRVLSADCRVSLGRRTTSAHKRSGRWLRLPKTSQLALASARITS